MGASMDPPTSRFAVVTCQRKGQSLYDRVHLHPREKLGSASKLSIIRDLAQAAGYLHAKGILIRRFNSHNVFLEPRAKLSLQDYSVIAEEEEDRPGYLVVPASLVWYTPPEILTQLADKTSSIPDSAFTTASDVFAFSVIMYEVCAGRYPYAKCDRRQYMENVCQGRRDTVQDIRVSDIIKNLITECWSHDPLYRPEFSQINAALHNRETSHLWHSSSEPENLHRLQFARNGFV
ncbi:hypothetical protein BOX15_Mlig000150g1 [Macrostomum lignano]|nr:hypothetical protein BOX15_Mlig000150g1 [Macrostomum lignano]